MNVLHRDLKLANILVHFKEADNDMVLAGGLRYQEYKKTIDLFDKKYNESDLRNDHTEIAKDVVPFTADN